MTHPTSPGEPLTQSHDLPGQDFDQSDRLLTARKAVNVLVPKIREALLRDIDDFCCEMEIKPTTFGNKAVGDTRFVAHLRNPDVFVRLETMAKAEEYIQGARDGEILWIMGRIARQKAIMDRRKDRMDSAVMTVEDLLCIADTPVPLRKAS